MTDLFRRLLAGPDDAPALVSGSGVVTFRALRQQAEVAAEALFGSGGKRLAFCFLPNSTAMVIAYLCAVTGGHAVGLFPPATPTDRKRRLVERYRPDVLIAPGHEPDGCFGGPGYRPLAWPGAGSGLMAWAAEPAGGLADELALLLSTSGSTGTPKLARLSAANIAANAAAIASSLGISPAQRAVTSLPVCHAYGLSVINSHLAAGSCVAVTEQSPLTPGFWRFAHEHGVVEVAGTPLVYRTVLGRRQGRDLPPSVRVMTQAGGRLGHGLSQAALTWMEASGGRFYCMYGQTEATSRISCLDSSCLRAKLGSVGTPLAGGRITVGSPLAGGADGPISYAGPNVMMGYALTRGDLRRGSEVGGLDTGDLGHLDEDGFLYVTGRSSRFVKVNDRRVSLDDVEEWFQLGDGCAAVADGMEAIVVFTTSRGARLETSRRALAATLGAPGSAVRTAHISAIPRTASGKVDYAQLEELAGTGRSAGCQIQSSLRA